MIQIGAPLAADFSDPLGVLSDCHRRIERFLQLLIVVSEQARGGELTAEQRAALDTALRYFAEAAPNHTADEEASLFPRLRAAGACAALDGLEKDHRAAHAQHERVDTLGRRWFADGRLPADAAKELAMLLHELQAVYQRHIKIEETEIFTLAGRILSADDLAELGREMARRRGLDPAALAGAQKRHSMRQHVVSVLFVVAVILLWPHVSSAHCDGMDGPVVIAAQKALDSGNVNLVLIWVQKTDEAEIKKAFERAVAVRQLNPQAKELADMYFFETLVRIHRAGEGAAYTGVKPAGRDLGPAIPAADKALQGGSVEPLVTLLTQAVQHGVHEHFATANAAKTFDKNDVQAGRKSVEAYVSFVHYVERLYEASKASAHGHFAEAHGAAAHAD